MIMVLGLIVFLLAFVFCLISERKKMIVYVEHVRPKYDYEAIKFGAYQRAIAGDNSARKWCEENIFSSGKTVYNTTTPKISLENDPIIADATCALVGVGMKKKEAKEKAKQLYLNGNKTVESIVLAAFKR